MSENNISPEESIKNYKQTTQIILDLQDDFKLSNGWKKKELIAHLLVWDIEFLKIGQGVLEGKGFEWSEEYMGNKLNEWNDKQLEKYKEKELDQVIETFKEKRGEVLDFYKVLIEKGLAEKNKEIFSLWEHDLYHLKQVKGETFALN